MVAIAEEAYFKLSKAVRDGFNGVLLYGSDEGQVASAQRRIVSGFTSDEEPLFLTGPELRSDPSLLEASFLGLSLFGGRRLIVVTAIDETHLPILSSIFGVDAIGNFIVFVAGSLNKSSTLRAEVEASRRFHALGFYEESEAELAARAARLLSAADLRPDEGVLPRLAELSGGERGVLEREIEKLSLYLAHARSVSLTDVEAVCGNASAFDAATLLEEVLSGDTNAVEMSLLAARANDETGQMLNALKWQLDRLVLVRAAYDQSGSWDQAFGRARPPVHFKAKERLRSILSRHTSTSLEQISIRVQETILTTRRQAMMGDVMAERFVLSAARELRVGQR